MDRLMSLENYLTNQLRWTETTLREGQDNNIFRLSGTEYRNQLADRIKMIKALQYVSSVMNVADRRSLDIILRGGR